MISKNTNLIIGKPESGKTRGIMFPEVENLINEGKNLFVVDNKEEYYPRFKKQLEKNGYKIFFINLRDPKQSNGFNVLSYPYYLYQKSKEKDLGLGLIISFAKTICDSDNKDSDPFWENTASDYLASLITILFDKGNYDEINFHSLAKIISNSNSNEGIVNLKDYVKKLDVETPTYRLAATCLFAPTDTKSSILSVLDVLVNPFICRNELLNTLSVDDLKIEDIKDNKVAIFFEGRSFTNKIASILIEQLLVEIRRSKIGFAFILDDANSLPKINDINELIEYASFNKIKSYFITNNLEELKYRYAKFTFDKITNIIDMKEIKDLELDNINNTIDYPRLKSENIKVIATDFLND